MQLVPFACVLQLIFNLLAKTRNVQLICQNLSPACLRNIQCKLSLPFSTQSTQCKTSSKHTMQPASTCTARGEQCNLFPFPCQVAHTATYIHGLSPAWSQGQALCLDPTLFSEMQTIQLVLCLLAENGLLLVRAKKTNTMRPANTQRT